ncbi:hypothetical protein Mapa_010730 [Marchantia paleacea]|nr:hypothetical protein Mapa_010730 [Marchantia paleacea]
MSLFFSSLLDKLRGEKIFDSNSRISQKDQCLCFGPQLALAILNSYVELKISDLSRDGD